LETERAQVRITVYDGANNSASAVSGGKFDIWPLPIITEVEYRIGDKDELRLSGRFFRNDESEIWVGDKQLKKVRFEGRYYTGNGTSKKVSSFDKKLSKRVPAHQTVMIQVRLPQTGQASPTFEFKRKRVP